MKDAYTEVETLTTQTKDRAQKIVAALYLLTNHIDQENPIRGEIRTQATRMLKAVLSGSKIEDIKSNILSFLAVALLTKDISPENISIIERELATLKVEYAQSSEPLLSHVFLQERDRVLFDNKETKQIEEAFALKASEPKIQSNVSDRQELRTQKDTSSYIKTKTLETNNDNNVFNRKEEKKARRTHVLSLLSKTELKTIKDVSKFFTDCSEKTIQRELNDLVEERMIVRVGDRRWSTYKLA
ncbi:MAG: hypothetical protein WAV09_03965 [Minisyncoccia bacterium]